MKETLYLILHEWKDGEKYLNITESKESVISKLNSRRDEKDCKSTVYEITSMKEVDVSVSITDKK